jgi:hypothetical protein
MYTLYGEKSIIQFRITEAFGFSSHVLKEIMKGVEKVEIYSLKHFIFKNFRVALTRNNINNQENSEYD